MRTEAIKELKRLLRKCQETPGAAVCSERMDGAAEARAEVRRMIRARIAELSSEPNSLICDKGNVGRESA